MTRALTSLTVLTTALTSPSVQHGVGDDLEPSLADLTARATGAAGQRAARQLTSRANRHRPEQRRAGVPHQLFGRPSHEVGHGPVAAQDLAGAAQQHHAVLDRVEGACHHAVRRRALTSASRPQERARGHQHDRLHGASKVRRRRLSSAAASLGAGPARSR